MADFGGEAVADLGGRQRDRPAVPLACQFEETFVAFLVVGVFGVVESVLGYDSEFIEQRKEILAPILGHEASSGGDVKYRSAGWDR